MRRILSVALVMACAGILCLARLDANRGYFGAQAYEDVYYLPPSDWLPIASLGYREAAADFVFMKALVYYGDGLAHRRARRHVAELVEGALALDPDMIAVYRWSTTWVGYQATAAPVDDLVRVARMLEAGARRHPSHGELAWWTGSFLSYELAMRYPPGSEERVAWTRAGAEHLARAASRGAGPRWLAFSNAASLARLGERQRAIEHMREIARVTGDEALRAQLRARIDELLGSTERDVAEQETETLERRWRAEFPYLPRDLYQLVGPRRIDTTSVFTRGASAAR